DRVAMWTKFSRPATNPLYTIGFDTWGYDVNQAATLPEARR
ncbi:microcin C ABC transporter periplasmic binding protein YejA, partial [Cronobacter sakazakii]